MVSLPRSNASRRSPIRAISSRADRARKGRERGPRRDWGECSSEPEIGLERLIFDSGFSNESDIQTGNQRHSGRLRFRMLAPKMTGGRVVFPCCNQSVISMQTNEWLLHDVRP